MNDLNNEIKELISTLTPAHQSTSQTSCSHNNSANTLLIFLYVFLDSDRIRTKHTAWEKKNHIA